jgi:FtsH-binding integral membrane protein
MEQRNGGNRQAEYNNPYATQHVQDEFYNPYAQTATVVDDTAVNAYVARVFGWMFIGLLVTALTTMGIVFGMATSYAFSNFMVTLLSTPLMWVVFIGQIVIAVTLNSRVAKMNPTTAKLMYVLYAVSVGFTVGIISVFISYGAGGNLNLLGMAFGVTSVSFGVMAIYGLVTKQDMTRFSNLFKMALIGFFIAWFANMFFGGAMFDFVVTVFGLFLFLGLTAYHTNTIKNYFAQVALNPDSASAMGARIDQQALASNIAIVGALMLYVAFINMFVMILRLLSRR